MKQTTNRRTRLASGTIIVLAVLLSNINLNAQDYSVNHSASRETAIENLIAGIESENYGLRKSAIYFAGKYEVTECVDFLLEQLKEEREPAMRKLIVRVLNKIGDSDIYYTIKKLAKNDPNPRVRNLCVAVYNDYVSQSTSEMALNTK